MDKTDQDELSNSRIIDVEKIPDGEARDKDAKAAGGEGKQLGSFEQLMWWVIALFAGVWIFLPEPTDAVPILGWLDEFTAMGILVMSLNRLGIKIPLLDRIFNKRFADNKGDDNKPTEKDVTPTPPAPRS